MKTRKFQVPEGMKITNVDLSNGLVSIFQAVEKVVKKDIRTIVKNYSDACIALSILPIAEEALLDKGFTASEIALRKLATIVEALNEGWKADWANVEELKHFPYFNVIAHDNADAGIVLTYSSYTPSYAQSAIGSRLCLKTQDLAIYAGKQFTDLYKIIFID